MMGLAIVSSWATGSGLRAKITDLEVAGGPVLFLYEATQSSDTTTPKLQLFHTTYKTPEGEVFATERGSFEGSEFQTYELDFPLLGESGKIERKDGKIVMSYRSPNGEKTAHLKARSNYVIGPTIPDYIRANWDEIMAGKSVEVRMIVAERLESFTFRFVKGREEKFNGMDAVKVLFKPSNRVIRMVVEPVELTFDKRTRRTLRIAGRNLMKKKDGATWVDFRGDMVFD